MEFRKIVVVNKSSIEISHKSKLIAVGSCFSDNIGNKLETHNFDVLNNPFGVVFNPIALASFFDQDDNPAIFESNGVFKSWKYHSTLSSKHIEKIKTAIIKQQNLLIQYLSNASHVFVTFGSAWGYLHHEQNRIVGNCHKMPQSLFKKQLSSVETIVEKWSEVITRYQHVNWVFTVSPVRHWKDGVRENNVSKGVLHQAIHELLSIKNVSYFPAYEIVMDELRDYRFFKNDMLHPNELAVDYIWEKFGETYFSKRTMAVNKEIAKLQKMKSHIVEDANSEEGQKFTSKIKSQEELVSSLF